MLHSSCITAIALFLISSVRGQSGGTTCGEGNLCPAELPCCSQYGQCGVGAYCLGGCDPMYSNQLDSCVPAPICKSQVYSFTSLDGITPNTEYLGDSNTTQWVSSGQPVAFDNSVLLTMAPNTVGTLLASTSYVWYGKVGATMKTSRTAGVVTAFILLSDVKDEIDFEFVGTDLNSVQSNFYFQGIPIYTNELNITVDDTFGTYHTYEVDWQPDSLTWLVDGTPHRTLYRNETFNSTSNQYSYPQTPARIELSLWPAGLPSNGQGTIDWAGGLVNWQSPDVINNGYFFAMIQNVSVQCYDPPPGAKVSGSVSYVYDNAAGTNNTVEITNDPTVLLSDLGTGTNMSAGASSGTATGVAATATNIPTVPGLTGGGPGGQRPGSLPSDTTTGVALPSASSTTFHGFAQNPGSDASTIQLGEGILKGSVLAFLGVIAGMFLL